MPSSCYKKSWKFCQSNKLYFCTAHRFTPHLLLTWENTVLLRLSILGKVRGACYVFKQVVQACFSFQIKRTALTDVVMAISYGKLKLVGHVTSINDGIT